MKYGYKSNCYVITFSIKSDQGGYREQGKGLLALTRVLGNESAITCIESEFAEAGLDV
jgi:hypothetical protein